MKFNVSNFLNCFVILLPCVLTVLKVLIFSVIFGILWGTILAWAKCVQNKILNAFARGYTTFIRCTPSIVLLYVVYYGLPILIDGAGFDSNIIIKEVYVIITFAMFCGASLSEVFRTSYISIDKGQHEAGISIGQSHFAVFRRIIFPQMFYTILPPMGNTIIAVLTEGSLGFAIGVVDIVGRANIKNNQTQGMQAFEIYIGVAIIYWSLSIIIGRGIHLLEKQFSKYKPQY